jgi:hypothetical protein
MPTLPRENPLSPTSLTSSRGDEFPGRMDTGPGLSVRASARAPDRGSGRVGSVPSAARQSAQDY